MATCVGARAEDRAAASADYSFMADGRDLPVPSAWWITFANDSFLTKDWEGLGAMRGPEGPGPRAVLDLLQIARVEALAEPTVDGSQKIARLLPLAMIAPQPGKAGRCAQLIGLCSLHSRDADCFFEGGLSLFNPLEVPRYPWQKSPFSATPPCTPLIAFNNILGRVVFSTAIAVPWNVVLLNPP